MKQKKVRRSQVADKLFRQLQWMTSRAVENLRDTYIPAYSGQQQERFKFMLLEYKRVSYALSQITTQNYNLRQLDFIQFSGKIRKIFLEICIRLNDISHEVPPDLIFSSKPLTGCIYDQDWLKKIIGKLELKWR